MIVAFLPFFEIFIEDAIIGDAVISVRHGIDSGDQGFLFRCRLVLCLEERLEDVLDGADADHAAAHADDIRVEVFLRSDSGLYVSYQRPAHAMYFFRRGIDANARAADADS